MGGRGGGDTGRGGQEERGLGLMFLFVDLHEALPVSTLDHEHTGTQYWEDDGRWQSRRGHCTRGRRLCFERNRDSLSRMSD